MNLYEAMDETRAVIDELDEALAALSYRQVNELLASLPNPTAIPEQLLAWRLETLKEAIEVEAGA